MGTTKPKRLSRQEELMNALGIGEHDLELNRQGKLSQQQKTIIPKREHLLILLIMGISCFIIGLFITGILVALVVAESLSGLELDLFLVAASSFAPILAFIATYYLLYRVLLLQEDLKLSQVKRLEGSAIVDLRERAPSTLIINKTAFRIKRNALLRIKHLEPHLVYYLPLSKIVVAVEVME